MTIQKSLEYCKEARRARHANSEGGEVSLETRVDQERSSRRVHARDVLAVNYSLQREFVWIIPAGIVQVLTHQSYS